MTEDKWTLEDVADNIVVDPIYPNQKCIEVIKEYAEKEKKYRWHDIRKNPDDLPEKDGNDESEYVLVLICQLNWNHWEQAYYNHGKGMWSTYEQNVFAWRYIEPFEEVEE